MPGPIQPARPPRPARSAQPPAGAAPELTDFAARLFAQVPQVRSRRRPRRPAPVTLRVRVDLAGTKPPVWRRLELSSALYLDELHAVLQLAFGWTDSHLHRFAVGSVYDPGNELYLCPFDEEQGEDEGLPTRVVRLDELLAEPGDRLTYVYDYGDDWEHRIKLEAVLDRGPDTPWARCTGGRREGPPEDCGGPWGYAEMLGQGADEPDFDVDDLDEELADWSPAVRDRRPR